ncbi:MAG: hypothetical protein ACFCUE_10240 [Candidatus Bathyarchaeia archaeon]
MANWKSLTLLFVLVFSSFTLVLPIANGTQPAVLFSDEFEGSQVDSSKWVVVENTDMSGYPAYGGNVTVSDGHISLSSDGSAFPWVYTKNNPFPTIGDFSVEFNLTFTCLGDWGSCIRIFADSPTIDADKWTGCVLSIGAGDEDPTRGKITMEFFGKEVHRIYVPGGFKPSADPHIFRLDYSQGNYTLYVDNTAVATVKSDIRASAIGLGHPPCYYLPFSPQKVAEWGYLGWTSLQYDYITVTLGKTVESSAVLFEDQFDGVMVDASKWLITENTDLSGYPAWGGKVTVQDGYIAFSSNGSTYPWVRTLNNPFPSNGDFTVEFNVTYTVIADSGNGIRIYSNKQVNNEYDWSNNIFTLWAHDEGETTGVILIELFNQVIYKDYVSGFKPSSPAHNYRFEYCGGNYTVYVDGKAVASKPSDLRPTAIGLGHPPVSTLPYSPETTQTWAYWGWSSFSMDYIKVVAATNGSSNQPEPTIQPLNGNSTFTVESNSTLSVINFNSQTNEASFTVTGPNGTTGFIRCVIPKSLLPDPNLLNLYLDGNKTATYSLTENSTDSWLLYFTYHHSSHTIMLAMQPVSQADFTIYAVFVAGALIGILAAALIAVARKLNK